MKSSRARLVALPGLVLPLFMACTLDRTPDPRAGGGAGAGGQAGGAAASGRAGASSTGGRGADAGEGGAGEAGRPGSGGEAGSGSDEGGAAGEMPNPTNGGAGASGEAGADSGGSSGSDGSSGSAGSGGNASCTALPALALTDVFSDHIRPVFAGQAPGDTEAWFIVEQTGHVMIRRPSLSEAPSVYLDVSTLIASAQEQGLLGLAFHPNFENNGVFYVNYTAVTSGESVIAEYERSTADVANPVPLRIIQSVPQPFANHNGGHLLFGPDGLLWVGFGDGGSGNDPEENAQDDSTYLGKMLRIAVNQSLPSVSIWAKGLRNPWRYSIDPVTELLYIGDVGQNDREEIDVVPADSEGGYNFGWRKYEGTLLIQTGDAEIPDRVPPVVETSHGEGNCAIVGGHVYRGSAIPCLQGSYLYGDYCTGLLRAFRYEDGVAVGDTALGVTAPGLSSFGVNHAGELYVVELGGMIRRIVAP